MNHDELLAKIEDNYWIDKPQQSLGYSSPEAWAALRAVVELAAKNVDEETFDRLDGYEIAMERVIQAIEKELK